MAHPCLSCGACCATFRVSLHWSETAPDMGGRTPVELTEPLGPHRVAMRGTWEREPRCVALDARVGEYSRCTIHELRPSPCREFEASWETGSQNPRCDQARARHGLAALTPEDWAS